MEKDLLRFIQSSATRIEDKMKRIKELRRACNEIDISLEKRKATIDELHEFYNNEHSNRLFAKNERLRIELECTRKELIARSKKLDELCPQSEEEKEKNAVEDNSFMLAFRELVRRIETKGDVVGIVEEHELQEDESEIPLQLSCLGAGSGRNGSGPSEHQLQSDVLFHPLPCDPFSASRI